MKPYKTIQIDSTKLHYQDKTPKKLLLNLCSRDNQKSITLEEEKIDSQGTKYFVKMPCLMTNVDDMLFYEAVSEVLISLSERVETLEEGIKTIAKLLPEFNENSLFNMFKPTTILLNSKEGEKL